jgi:hypothetical protein
MWGIFLIQGCGQKLPILDEIRSPVDSPRFNLIDRPLTDRVKLKLFVPGGNENQGEVMTQCFNPNCLHRNQAKTKFCQKCGNKLLLGDRYRAINYIGEGGFGRTFRAIDEKRLNTPCVIKQFLPQQQGTPALQKAEELFKQEAVRLRDLGHHPQIPDLLSFEEQDGRFYLVQQFIDGQDLLRELSQRGKFNEAQIRQLLNDLLPVLDFCHQKK